MYTACTVNTSGFLSTVEKKGLFSLSGLPFLFWVKGALYNLVINSGLMKANRDYRFFLKQHLFQIKRARELHWL